MRTIRERAFGKARVRLVQAGAAFKVAVLVDGKVSATYDGVEADEVWQRAIGAVGKSVPGYWGYDDARSRFIGIFGGGFADRNYREKERAYKEAAASFIRDHVPIEAARTADATVCEAANKAFAKTNMATPIEKTRVQALLRSDKGPAYLAAVARLADGDTGALPALDVLMREHGQPSWPCATYLPFFWHPKNSMFLKPQVTKDFANRVGHRFGHDYDARLNAHTYRSLLDLAAECEREIAPLGPADRIDIQSFIWVLGAYSESDADQIASSSSC